MYHKKKEILIACKLHGPQQQQQKKESNKCSVLFEVL